jgi:hypothetical protein
MEGNQGRRAGLEEEEIGEESNGNSEEGRATGGSRIGRSMNGMSNRRRREIKMEREEIISLFSNLVSIINSIVLEIESEEEKYKIL